MKQLRQRTKINFLKEEPSKEAIEKVKEISQALKKTEGLRNIETRQQPMIYRLMEINRTSAHQTHLDGSNRKQSNIQKKLLQDAQTKIFTISTVLQTAKHQVAAGLQHQTEMSSKHSKASNRDSNQISIQKFPTWKHILRNAVTVNTQSELTNL